MRLTVIIPTLNEAANIERLLQWLKDTSKDTEIFVVDGGSKDKTVEIAKQQGATVLISPTQSRAAQMNLGAKHATGEVLYFVHADVIPPKTWDEDIINAVQNDQPAGCFSYCFETKSKWLIFVSRVTRRKSFISGGGDQTMFVKRSVFEELNGFKESLCIMEDFDFVWRLEKKYPFILICNDVLISARKFENNSYLFVQTVNLLVVVLFKLGMQPEKLRRMYRSLLAVR